MKLMKEKPYVFAIKECYVDKLCHNCLNAEIDTAVLKKCSRCKFSRYCNAGCQKEDFKEHKLQCRLLEAISQDFPSMNVRLQAQMVLKRWRRDITKRDNVELCTLAFQYNDGTTASPMENYTPMRCWLLRSAKKHKYNFGIEIGKRVLDFLLLNPKSDISHDITTTMKGSAPYSNEELKDNLEFEKLVELCIKVNANYYPVVSNGASVGIAIYLNISTINPLQLKSNHLSFEKKYGVVCTRPCPHPIFEIAYAGLSSEIDKKLPFKHSPCFCPDCMNPDQRADILSFVCKIGKSVAKPTFITLLNMTHGQKLYHDFLYFNSQTQHTADLFSIQIKCTRSSCNKVYTLNDFKRELGFCQGFVSMDLKNLLRQKNNCDYVISDTTNIYATIRKQMLSRPNLNWIWFCHASNYCVCYHDISNYDNNTTKLIRELIRDTIWFLSHYDRKYNLRLTALLEKINKCSPNSNQNSQQEAKPVKPIHNKSKGMTPVDESDSAAQRTENQSNEQPSSQSVATRDLDSSDSKID